MPRRRCLPQTDRASCREASLGSGQNKRHRGDATPRRSGEISRTMRQATPGAARRGIIRRRMRPDIQGASQMVAPAGNTGWPLQVHKEREIRKRAAAAHASLAEHMDRVRPGWRSRVLAASGQDASQRLESKASVRTAVEPTHPPPPPLSQRNGGDTMECPRIG
jgi:hypothetical protein